MAKIIQRVLGWRTAPSSQLIEVISFRFLSGWCKLSNECEAAFPRTNLKQHQPKNKNNSPRAGTNHYLLSWWTYGFNCVYKETDEWIKHRFRLKMWWKSRRSRAADVSSHAELTRCFLEIECVPPDQTGRDGEQTKKRYRGGDVRTKSESGTRRSQMLIRRQGPGARERTGTICFSRQGMPRMKYSFIMIHTGEPCILQRGRSRGGVRPYAIRWE